MSADGRALERLARLALSGRGSHVETKDAFSGLRWQAAGLKPHGVFHSVYQLLKHMSYWQDWVVAWLGGGSPAVPRHASGSWPTEAGPTNRRDWDEAVLSPGRGWSGFLHQHDDAQQGDEADEASAYWSFAAPRC